MDVQQARELCTQGPDTARRVHEMAVATADEYRRIAALADETSERIGAVAEALERGDASAVATAAVHLAKANQRLAKVFTRSGELAVEIGGAGEALGDVVSSLALAITPPGERT